MLLFKLFKNNLRTKMPTICFIFNNLKLDENFTDFFYNFHYFTDKLGTFFKVRVKINKI